MSNVTLETGDIKFVEMLFASARGSKMGPNDDGIEVKGSIPRDI